MPDALHHRRGAHADRPLRRRARRRAARRPRRARGRRGGRAQRDRPAPRSRTSTSARPTRPARTTATWRAWPRCSPGLPVTVPGATVNRLCASGLEAVSQAARAVRGGDGDLLPRRRRRVDDARAARDAEVRQALRARGARDGRHHDRLALRQPAHGGALPDRRAWARPPRTWPSATRSRAPTRTRFALRSHQLRDRGAGGGPLRRRARPGRARRQGAAHRRRPTRARAPTPRSRSSPSCGPSSARAARSPPATRRRSTTAPRAW